MEEGRRRAESRGVAERIRFIQGDAKAVVQPLASGAFDLAVCIGSTHALGGLAETLHTLKKCVKPGGYMLIGEGYWKQTPSPAYLEALGEAQESDMLVHAGNVRTGEEAGLIPLWSYVVSEDE